jgi:hypothetical protein
MQQERDLLVKMTVPKLRKMCMERDVIFSYVDLRWYGTLFLHNENAILHQVNFLSLEMIY